MSQRELGIWNAVFAVVWANLSSTTGKKGQPELSYEEIADRCVEAADAAVEAYRTARGG